MDPGGHTWSFTFFAIVNVMESKFCKINMFIKPKRTIFDLVVGAYVDFGHVTAQSSFLDDF